MSDKIKFLVAGLISFFIIAIGVLISILGIRQMIRTATESFSVQGISIVEKAVSMVDGDAFEALSKSMDINDPFYEETRINLLQFKKSTNCIYLYTMSQVDGDIWQFIIDGSSEPDDQKHFSKLGDKEDTRVYDNSFRRVLTSGKTESGYLANQGDWGWIISFYAPIKNSSGKIVGIAGCDFDGTPLHNSVEKRIGQLAIIGAIVVMFGIMLFLFLR